MAITFKEGFQIFNEGTEHESLAIQSERIEEYMDYFRSSNIQKLFISSFHGYQGTDISFLIKYPFIEDIFIFSNAIDYSPIHSLHNLRSLILSVDKKGTIDFSQFPNLEFAVFSWKHSIKNLDACIHLRELHLRDYRSLTATLSDIPPLNGLIKLELIQAQIESLEGLSKFSKLEELELQYLNKLKSLKGVEEIANTLINLLINNSRKILDHFLVSSLKQLKELAFNDCGEIDSIGFLRSLPRLETFRFVNTNVKDGDLTPCKGLSKVRFTYKKHYSHKPEELGNIK